MAPSGSWRAASLHILWSNGKASPGDVVVVSGLTLRVLHSSKDMALSLVDVAQQFGLIEETLSVIAKPRLVQDRSNAPKLLAYHGEVEFRNVQFGYGLHHKVLDGH